MSLYHEAASILTRSNAERVSIKTTVFGKKDWKNPSKVLLALASETAKWSSVLSEVVENSGVLQSEKQLTPVLALVLVHDLLLSKKRVALPQSHGLNVSVQRHKARLSAEFTKSRIRRACSSIDQLRAKVEQEANEEIETATGQTGNKHPRWLRINTIRSSKEEQMMTTFKDYKQVHDIQDVLQAGSNDNIIFIDPHIPNLVAIPSAIDLTSSKAYKDGKIIFQDKASCFPAYLIDPRAGEGDLIDACAAPGNKTTHLAAILDSNLRGSEQHASQTIFACEKDPLRSHTLTKMTTLAGGEKLIQVKQHQNFLKLDPNDPQYANVTKLLLDPSCSGSGIVSRDQGAVTVHLPQVQEITSKNKKRKRTTEPVNDIVEEEAPIEAANADKLADRLQHLADFQLRLLLHAMSFPAAKQISYSTCSIHATENEEVVIRALRSDVARGRGWTIQRRDQQIEGIRAWHVRGDVKAVESCIGNIQAGIRVSAKELANACVRCNKHGNEGTMGFFVAGFIRDDSTAQPLSNGHHDIEESDGENDDWCGFDDP